jgi:hypothetical protein
MALVFERQASACLSIRSPASVLFPAGWTLELTTDELLGPMPHVVGPDGQRLTLAEFEAQLRDRRIDLDAA